MIFEIILLLSLDMDSMHILYEQSRARDMKMEEYIAYIIKDKVDGEHKCGADAQVIIGNKRYFTPEEKEAYFKERGA